MSSKQRVDTSTTCSPETMAVATVTEVRTLPVILETVENSIRPDEFENSEFYIEESLPSSLEWGRDERQVHLLHPKHAIVQSSHVARVDRIIDCLIPDMLLQFYL